MVKVMLPVPDGFEPPEGKTGDDSFDVLITVKIVGNKFQVLAVEGLPYDADENGGPDDGDDTDFLGSVERGATATPSQGAQGL